MYVCEFPNKMASLYVLGVISALWVALASGNLTNDKKCPVDYRQRVETCIMEAQVAPQAGGGLTLIMEQDKLDQLCERGVLHKTIDCLQNILDRCSDNTTKRHELDMLFNLEDWRQGMDLLCEDLNRKLVFRNHFGCLSQFTPRIASCILIRTQMFKKAVLDAGMATHKTLHDITCNYAENIVNCLESPLSKACPILVVDTMVAALHRFLPPACAPVPAVNSRHGEAKNADDTVLETVILEGGGGTE